MAASGREAPDPVRSSAVPRPTPAGIGPAPAAPNISSSSAAGVASRSNDVPLFTRNARDFTGLGQLVEVRAI